MDYDESRDQLYPTKSGDYVRSEERTLDYVDYIILGLVKYSTNQTQRIYKKITQESTLQVSQRINEMSRLGLIQSKKGEGWIKRNWNPTLFLTDIGMQIIDRKSEELRKEWEQMHELYKKKKQDAFQGMMNIRLQYIPLFFMMGLANGTILSNIMSEMGMNYDEVYVSGFADGVAKED